MALLVRSLLVFSLAAAGVFACGSDGFALYADRLPTEAEASANYTGARLEPRFGCYAGAFIDLDNSLTEVFKDKTGRVRRLPSQFEDMVGKEHATYFYYMAYGSRFAMDWVQYLGERDKIVHIALEPNNGLEWVKDDKYLDDLASDLKDSGARVFLRFGSEMNGPWVKYHGNPSLYIEKFRLVARKMHEKAPNVAMVWCPYATPSRLIGNYYPGDAAVDWVGVNLYSVTYYDQDWKKPAWNVHPTELLDYVYDRYSKKKPIMVGEFGATHFSALEQKSVPAFAIRSIEGLYGALPLMYPRVKCINYFCGNNLTLDHRKNNNYAVTQNQQVLERYRQSVSLQYFLSRYAESDGYPSRKHALFPVDAQGFSPELPLSPFPVVQKQKVSGTVRLRGWYQDMSGQVELRFLVGSKPVKSSTEAGKWFYDLDTTAFENGRLKLELRAYKKSDLLKLYSISVIVEN